MIDGHLDRDPNFVLDLVRFAAVSALHIAQSPSHFMLESESTSVIRHGRFVCGTGADLDASQYIGKDLLLQVRITPHLDPIRIGIRDRPARPRGGQEIGEKLKDRGGIVHLPIGLGDSLHANRDGESLGLGAVG